MDQVWAFVAGLFGIQVALGWSGLVGVLLGMGIYHQMLKRWPALLAWLLSGVKNAGDALTGDASKEKANG